MAFFMQIWDLALAITSWGTGVLLGLVMLSGVIVAAVLALWGVGVTLGALYVATLLAIGQVRKLLANRRGREAEGVE
ncbi:MAG: hypothetical protein RI841_16315 [Halomonas sp.]|uniref:hypothetical protein n=1 Tax=Halomonas sp. TaxID=1486246 RepID=UPI0028707A5D|nr:hypothetical protein [Halomonas sp.]MDR9441045.1 hypothetical protein [Halomonas sp.]